MSRLRSPRGWRLRNRPLSTGVKMLLALSIALLPLGIVAVVAAIETADRARVNSDSESRFVAEVAARRLSDAIGQTTVELRAATAAISLDSRNIANCRGTLDALAGLQQFTLDLAIYRRNGSLACQSEAFPAPLRAPSRGAEGLRIELDTITGSLRFLLVTNGGRTGLAHISGGELRRIAEPPQLIDNYRLTLAQGDRSLVLNDWRGSPPADVETIDSRLAGGAISSSFAFETAPIQPIEALQVVVPVLMLVVAAILSWFLVRSTFLRPLAELERAVSSYRAGDKGFALPPMDKAALELRTLGDAFEAMVAMVRRHEQDLEAGIAEQVRLTREVHHRVKNNLQVVASLLSLHARAAATPDTAFAYASIQRRVDALAVVQRNLFAEADQAVGLSLRAVIAELASGLQHTAPANARLTMTLGIANVRVAQDIAVPIAFMVTELVELAMLADSQADIAISVGDGIGNADRVLLTVISPALVASQRRGDFERYARVLAGLARQIRAPLEQDAAIGRYAITIPVIVAVGEPSTA